MNQQEERIENLLNLERAGGLSMGTGLGNGFRITHTTGTDGEGRYASFVVLTACDGDGKETSVVFDPTWSSVGSDLIASLRYHCDEAARITAERQQKPNVYKF